MPELPEVETIRSQITETLPLKVTEMELSEFAYSIILEEQFKMKGKTILKVDRHGKQLIFHIEPQGEIHSGLGMSGSWMISPKKITEKHTHIQFKGKKGKKVCFLAYVDPRRFGKMRILKKEAAILRRESFGVDVSSKKFTATAFFEATKKFPNKMIKPFLLEQKVFCGVGNYMASEVCARAGIRPERLLGKITKKECCEIKKAMSLVLNQAIESGGTTFQGGYRDSHGDPGKGVTNLVVFYQDICGLCKKHKVIKETLQGRGTYYCPKCQS